MQIETLLDGSPSDVEVATTYNATLPEWEKTEITARDLLERFGVDAADALVTSLSEMSASRPSVAFILETLKSGASVDLGNPVTRSVLNDAELDPALKESLLAFPTENSARLTPGQVGVLRGQYRDARHSRKVLLDAAIDAAREAFAGNKPNSEISQAFSLVYDREGT